MGRPQGSKNKAPQFRHYQPKKWEPWMDSLVLHKVLGLSNEELAEKFEISTTHVSNILSTTQAREVKEKVRKEVLGKSTDVADRLSSIQDKAVEAIEEFINDKTLMENKPFMFMDRAMAAFKLTKGDSESKKTEVNVTTNNITFSPQQENKNQLLLARLSEGLEKSNQVLQLHKGEQVVDYEIVKEEKVG